MSAALAPLAAAGPLGLGPLAISALLSFAPGLLSALFGNNQEALRREIAKLTSPQAVGGLTEQFYQQALSSPAYSQGQASIASGANRASNTLASSLAARGLGTTGIGSVLSSLTPSLVGSQQAGLKTQAYNYAGTQAQQSLQARINALLGTQGPSDTQKYFAGGLSALGPILQAYLRSRFPGGLTGIGT